MIIRQKLIKRAHLESHLDRLYVFGDNILRRGRGGQAAEMRGEPNAVGIPTKWRPTREDDAYFRDADWEDIAVRTAISKPIARLWIHLWNERHVVIPEAGIGSGLAQLYVRAPQIYGFIEMSFEAMAAAYGIRHE